MEMATAINEDKPGIEERYQTANNTSNLVSRGGDADKGGAVDILIAAGWSRTRIGMALLRLHSEFDASEKPVKPTPASISALVGTRQRRLVGEELPPGIPQERTQELSPPQAREYARQWYMHEMHLLTGKLKSLPDAREQLALQGLKWGMGQSADPVTRSDESEQRRHDEAMLDRMRKTVQDAGDDEASKVVAQASLNAAQMQVDRRIAHQRGVDLMRAREKAAGVIRYWLDQTCPHCHGLRWELIPGTPSLSGRMCKPCGGTGVGQVPHGQDGRKLANYMDSCVEDARGSLQRNLSARRKTKT